MSAEPSAATVDSVEAAAALLYQGPLANFVADRDALVKQTRAAGERELANAIKALRKPTVAAAALNQALQADPDAVEALLVAVTELRQAQEGLLTGDGTEDFGARRTAYRQAVESVVAAAPSHQDEVAAAVEAAAIGGQHEELRAAAFALTPQPTGGFGPFEVGPGTVTGSSSSRSAGAAAAPTDSEPLGSRGPSAAERRLTERARRAAQEALALARAAHRSAQAAATEAVSAVDQMDEEVAALSERLDQLRASRDDAVVVRAEAEAKLSAANDQLELARAALDAL